MLFKARLLLVAHASLFFGAVMSGAILSESLATHRPLNLWTWSFFGAICIVEIALAGMHAHHHVPSASVVPASKRRISAGSQSLSLRPTELAESLRLSHGSPDTAAADANAQTCARPEQTGWRNRRQRLERMSHEERDWHWLSGVYEPCS